MKEFRLSYDPALLSQDQRDLFVLGIVAIIFQQLDRIGVDNVSLAVDYFDKLFCHVRHLSSANA